MGHAGRSESNRTRPRASERLGSFAQELQIAVVAESAVPELARQLADDAEFDEQLHRRRRRGERYSGAAAHLLQTGQRTLFEDIMHPERRAGGTAALLNAVPIFLDEIHQ